MTKKCNAVVGQSGGPTSVINASLFGVIEECRKNDQQIGTLYGALNGVEGIIQENLIDLFSETQDTLAELREMPGAALGGCRYQLHCDDPSDGDMKLLFKVFAKYNIKYFFYIGGNDSMDTANKIDSAARKMQVDLKVIGVPKTIDNDLMATDHCPGYGSCARYLITTVVEAGIHARNMKDSEPVTILVTVGRNAGWLPAACGYARRLDDDAPHILCFPEVSFERKTFLNHVKWAYEKYGYVFIVTGEGLLDPDGNYVTSNSDEIQVDAFGHPALGGIGETLKSFIEQDLQLRTEVIKPGVSQQGSALLASGVDLHEAEMCGRTAVQMAISGQSGFMVVMVRDSNSPYFIRYDKASLIKIANFDRMVPNIFIAPDGISVTNEFIEYITPLIQGAPTIENSGGIKFYKGLTCVPIAAD